MILFWTLLALIIAAGLLCALWPFILFGLVMLFMPKGPK